MTGNQFSIEELSKRLDETFKSEEEIDSDFEDFTKIFNKWWDEAMEGEKEKHGQ